MPPKRVKRTAGDHTGPGKRLRRNISEAQAPEGEMVIVQVGIAANRKAFIVDRDATLRHSNFFAEALAQSKSSSGAHTVKLPDEGAELFNLFRHFVTSGQIYSSHDDDYECAKSDEQGDGTDREWGRLIDSWLLGERIQSCSFKYAIVDTIIEKVIRGDCYSPDIQDDIYPQSKKTSAIRKLVVDMAIWAHEDGTLEKQRYKKDLSRFYYDLALALNAAKVDGVPTKAPYQGRNTCKYHEHEQEGKPCYKTMLF